MRHFLEDVIRNRVTCFLLAEFLIGLVEFVFIFFLFFLGSLNPGPAVWYGFPMFLSIILFGAASTILYIWSLATLFGNNYDELRKQDAFHDFILKIFNL